MVRCPEFYRKFAKEGNFCKSSPKEASEILKYIDYCSTYRIGLGGINMNALKPLMRIEGTVVHDRALQELKDRINSLTVHPKDVTQRYVSGIIRTVNREYRVGDKRRIRDRDMMSASYAIEHLGEGTIGKFRKFKNKYKFKTNEDIIDHMLELLEMEKTGALTMIVQEA